MLVVAGLLTLAIAMLAGVVLQVGVWMQHRRDAQLRVDAAALAGGQLFGQCFDSRFSAAQASTNMREMAKHYAGFPSAVPGAPLNAKFGGGTATPLAFASKTYPSGGGGGPDDTSTQPECTSMELDVKLQDTNIPPLMSIFPQATVRSHARVQLQSIQSFKGAFPLAIPQVEPKYVAATFVDEAGGELTGCGSTGRLAGTNCTYPLAKGSTFNNLTAWSAPASPSLPSAVTPAQGRNVGVRIGMGSLPGSCAGTGGTENWACFDAGATGRGALMIRTYSAAAAGAAQSAAPILRQVYPWNNCPPAFAAQFGQSPFLSDAGGVTTCSVGVRARIDFGTAVDPTKTVVKATVNGAVLTLSRSKDDPGLWESSGTTVPVDDAGTTSGYPVTMQWEEQVGSKVTKGSFNGGAAVARITSATGDDEGPIKLMSVAQGGAPAYSLTPGVQTVDVEIRIQAALGRVDPPVLQALRLTGNGSRTTAVNCDGNGNSDFVASIVGGCKTPYQINKVQICPDPAPPAGPADCVPVKTGNLGNTVVKALDTRFAGCPPDRWATDGATYPGDPRLVVMMLTDFSAYAGQGKTQVPVTDFAAFYVIGWSGNKCGAAWPFPGPEPNGGNIWGYFVKYAALTQIPNGQVCDPIKITPCAPVLVR